MNLKRSGELPACLHEGNPVAWLAVADLSAVLSAVLSPVASA